MVSIPVSEATAQRLQQAAMARSASLQKLADQAVDEFLHADERRAMQQELEAYCLMHDQIRQRYFGQYVAIYQGKLVDFDSDLVTLAERIGRRYPDLPVLITPVREEPIETFTIHSPRFDLAH